MWSLVEIWGWSRLRGTNHKIVKVSKAGCVWGKPFFLYLPTFSDSEDPWRVGPYLVAFDSPPAGPGQAALATSGTTWEAAFDSTICMREFIRVCFPV